MSAADDAIASALGRAPVRAFTRRPLPTAPDDVEESPADWAIAQAAGQPTTAAPSLLGRLGGAVADVAEKVGEYIPSPIKAALQAPGAATGALVGQLVDPEAYWRAYDQNAAGINKDGGEFTTSEQIRSAPGVGSVLRESLSPRQEGERGFVAAAKDTAAILGDIVTDPSVVLGGGLPRAGRLAKFAAGGARAADIAPDVSRVGAAVEAAGRVVGSPAVGAVYAPELLTGVGRGLESGDYWSAALQAGLGGLMASGMRGEAPVARAAEVDRPVRQFTSEPFPEAATAETYASPIPEPVPIDRVQPEAPLISPDRAPFPEIATPEVREQIVAEPAPFPEQEPRVSATPEPEQVPLPRAEPAPAPFEPAYDEIPADYVPPIEETPRDVAPEQRAGDRREFQEPIPPGTDQRVAARRAEVAADLKLPEDHPAVQRLLTAEDDAAVSKKEARTDPLTGLGNKRHWEELQGTVTPDDHVVILDLKKFKPVNDRFGHKAGDLILQKAGAIVRDVLGEESSRFGGDEFGGVVRGATPERVKALQDEIVRRAANSPTTLRNPKTGESVDIPGFEVHIAGGTNAEAADLAVNTVAEASRAGGRGDIAIAGEPVLDRPIEAAPRPDGAGLGDRESELAPADFNPADLAASVEPSAARVRQGTPSLDAQYEELARLEHIGRAGTRHLSAADATALAVRRANLRKEIQAAEAAGAKRTTPFLFDRAAALKRLGAEGEAKYATSEKPPEQGPAGTQMIQLVGPKGDRVVLTAKAGARGASDFDPLKQNKAGKHELQAQKLTSRLGSDEWIAALAQHGLNPDEVVGFAHFREGEGTLKPGMVFVDPELQRQGVATAMYDAAMRASGLRLGKGVQRPEGQAFREAYDGRAPTGTDPKYATSEKPKAPAFYSQLQRVAEDPKAPNAGRGGDWQRYLSDPKRGVKADELRWTGLDDFLKERANSRVTKQEIAEFLKQNAVEVKDVTLGQDTKPNWQLRYKDGSGTFQGYRTRAEAQSALDEFGFGDRMEVVPEPSLDTAPTKFSQYVLPGGKEGSYRELLLTLPEKGNANNEAITARLAEISEMPASEYNKRRPELDAEYDRLRAQLDPIDKQPQGFRSGHYDEPNILAHVRFDERTDAQGKRVLHIAEVQSDWAQKGRREGFDGERKAYEVRRGDEVLGSYSAIGDAEAWLDRAKSAAPTAARGLTIHETVSSKKGTPTAPFVEDTGHWSSLAMKRMVRYAAENGFDRVTWDTGETQAARYDLSKQIDSISWRKNADGTIALTAEKGGRDVVADDYAPDKLPEVIGKELSDRIATEIEGGKNDNVYSGLDLKVGGEGMAGFYDKILPQVAAKIGKKWGAKVGESNLEGRKRSLDTTLKEDFGSSWGEASQELRERAIAAKASGVGPRVHSLDITPEMKRSVMEEGQPLFKAGGKPVAEPQAPNREAVRSILRDIFKNQRVNDAGDGIGFVIDTVSGKKVYVDPVAGISFGENLAQHGAEIKAAVEAGERSIAGSMQTIDGVAVVKIVNEGVLPHEIGGHVFREYFATDRENAFIDKEWAPRAEAEGKGRSLDEVFADDYNDWWHGRRAAPNTAMHRVFTRIRDFFERAKRALGFESREGLFREIESSRPFDRPDAGTVQGRAIRPIPPGATPGEAYATAPVPTAQTAQKAPYSGPDETFADKAARMFQDQTRRIEVVEKDVKSKGGTSRDVHEAFAGVRSKASYEQELATKEYVEPLIKEMGQRRIDSRDLDDYMTLLHKPTRDAVIATRSDGQNIEGSGWTQADAATRWNELESKYGARQGGKLAGLEDAADYVRDMRENALDRAVDGGLLSKEQAKSVRDTWGADYVPQRTFEVEDGIESLAGGGSGFPVAFTINQLLRTIDRAEKNKADQNFGKWVEDNDLFPIDKEHKTHAFDAAGKSTERPDQLAAAKDFTYKVNGETRRISIADSDPLLDRALRNMSAESMKGFVGHVGNVTRRFSRLATSGIGFLTGNQLRDIQAAMVNVSAEHGSKAAAKVLTGIPNALSSMFKFSKSPKDPSLQLVREFREDGGAVGWSQVRTPRDIESDITTQVKTAGPGAVNAGRRAIRSVAGFVDDANKAVENATRFSVYKALREAGLDRAKAGTAARNVSLDFTKKGEVSPALNALYAFFNANVQGTKRLKEVAIDNPRGRKIVAGIVAMGASMDYVNRANAGDANDDGTNDYDDIPEFVKQKNFVIMRGKGEKPMLIPMPYGFNIFHTAGRQLAATVGGATSPAKAALSVMGSTYNAFNPLGGEAGFVQAITPTALDPFVQHATNESWSGRKLKPEQAPFGGARKPESQLAWKNVSPTAKAIAETLNKLSGGDKVTPGYIDISPEVISHYAGALNSYATGAVGREVAQVAEIAGTVASGKTPEIRNIPVAKKFVYEPSPGLSGQKYRENSQELEDLDMRAKAYVRDKNRDGYRSIPAPMLSAKRSVDQIEKQIAALRKREKATGKDVSEQIVLLQNRANKIVAGARAVPR